MALEKTTMTTYGVEANYHKISVTDINWHDKNVLFKVASFVSNVERLAGKQPINSWTYSLAGDSFILSPDVNILATLYNYLKTLPEWEGSIDV